MGAGMSREMCTKNEFKRDGAQFVGNAECKIGESKIVSRSVMTLDRRHRVPAPRSTPPTTRRSWA